MSNPRGDGKVPDWLSRRKLIQTAGLGTAALLAGCAESGDGGDGANGEDDDNGEDGTTGEDGGDETKVFIEGMGANTSTLDIHGEPRVPNGIVQSSIHDTLFVVNFDLDIVPHLVDEYDRNEDATQFDFYLQDGIEFHDGNPLTAEAVKRTHDRMLEISPESYLLGPVENIEAVDDLHVRYELESSFPLLERNLTTGYTGILSPDAVDEYGDSYGQDIAVGTGPFEFERWDRGEQIVLTRNEDYDWGPDFIPNSGPAKVDEFQFRHVPEDTTLFNELTVGNVHGTTYVPTAEADSIAEHEATSLERVDFPHPDYLAVNVTRPPTDDIRVRRAIGHAINREDVIAAALHGEAYPIWSIVPPGSVNSLSEEEAKDRGQPFDPDRSRQLLEDAGWTNSGEGEVRTKDGEELSIYFTAFTIDRYSRIGEVVQAMLGSVGFDVNLEILEAGTLYETLQGSEHNVTTMAWSRAKYALEVLLPTLEGEQLATEGGTNFSIWANDEFDELLSTAQSSPDADTRESAIKDAQRVVLDEVPVVPIMGYMKHYGYKNEVDLGSWIDHPWWPEQDSLHRLEVDLNE